MIINHDVTIPDYSMILDENSVNIVLKKHKHTKYCDRKTRVCTTVGKYREFETLKIKGIIPISSNVPLGGCVWLRGTNLNDINSFIPIPGTDNLSKYIIQKEDINQYISFRGTYKNNLTNELNIIYSNNIVGPIEPAPAKVLDLHITGELKVGNIITGEGIYVGGYEGPSEYWWIKIDSEGNRTQITEPSSNKNSNQYLIKDDDINCSFKVKCKPISKASCIVEV